MRGNESFSASLKDTWTVGPTRNIAGARINTAWKGAGAAAEDDALEVKMEVSETLRSTSQL